MASASSGSVCAAPSDYDEFYAAYSADIKRVVWRQLGPLARPQDVDDCVSYIFQQFLKNDVMAQYRPDYVSDYTGVPVKFRAFVMAKVPLYCRGFRQTLARRGREPLLVDAPGTEDGSASLVDLMGATSDEYPSLTDDEALERLRTALAERSQGLGRAPVLPLFDALTTRFTEGKSVSPLAIRGKFSLNPEQAAAWFEELQGVLREASAPRSAPAGRVPACFELGGMLLTASQVRAAADALRASHGNRVMTHFTEAGHPLAKAGKTWYLDFAAEVQAKYPETRVAKGGHYPGGHFGKVKAALIYGLDKLLGESPDEPWRAARVVQGPWQELDDVLRQFPGITGQTREAALEAVRSVVLGAA